MKKLLLALLISTPLISYSQSTGQKLPKDSIAYYRRQLSELRKATYDSMINSEKYKTVFSKLNPDGKNIDDNFGVELSFFTGLQKNDYSNLNARLTSLNVKKKKSLLLPVGIGLAFRFNKLIIGYDMTPTMIGDNSTGSYLHGYVSTNIVRIKRWIFSPQIGYGIQGFTTLIPTTSSASEFNDYFTTSANQVELSHRNKVLDFAIAFKVYPPKNNVYIPLFRLGYRYGINDKIWEVSNGTSLNAPSDRNSNFYFQLMFGFGD